MRETTTGHPQRKALARLSTEYLVAFLSEGVAETGLDILDFVLMLTVGANNIGYIKDHPEVLDEVGGVELPVPPQLMHGVSRRAVAETLGLPYETARRRIQSLVERGILREAGHGAITIGALVNESNTANRLANKNAALLLQLMRQVHEAGVDV